MTGDGGRRRAAFGRAHDERGQALVEFVLALPLLCILVFAITSFGVTFNHYIKLTDAVRVGARAAAVNRESGACAAAEAAIKATVTAADWARMTFSCTPGANTGDPVTVSATYPYAIKVLDLVVKSGDLTSSATERLE